MAAPIPTWVCLRHFKEGRAIQSTFARVPKDGCIGIFIIENSPPCCHVVEVVGHCLEKDSPIHLPNDMPCEAIFQFGIKFVDVKISEDTNPSPAPAQNAFSILMNVNRSYDWLPPEKADVRNKKEKLYNDVLDVCRSYGVGFTDKQHDVGTRIMTTLTDVCWYLDPFVSNIERRSMHIPKKWKLQGYRDPKLQHKRSPQISSEELASKIDALAKILMFPWFMNEKFGEVRTSITSLLSAMEAYKKVLADQLERTTKNQASLKPVRALNDSWALKVIEANTNPTCVPPEYDAVIKQLQSANFYEAVCLEEFEPKEPTRRRKWRNGIENVMPMKVSMFTVHFGNFLGTTLWFWRIPDAPDTAKEITIVANIKDNLPKYSTRAIRREFFEQYGTMIKPYVLRNMFFELTDYEYTTESAKCADIDDRFLNFLATSDDDELIVDLRKNNGRVADPKYDPFWSELGKLLDETAIVDDRRSNSLCYLPVAISVEDLKRQVEQRLPSNTPIPSASWIKLNFMPSRQFTSSAAHYTGRFNVKYAVQQRLLRAQHEDAPFALRQYYMLKDMTVKYREHSRMQCLDDKAIIPVGEPDKPVSTGVRAHHRGITIGNGNGMLCLDHDYHLGGIVPSVCFEVDIPEHSKDSFHKGSVHVTVKDKVFQPSSPLRHAAENWSIVRESYSDDGVNLDKPILFRYTDGGPDHRTTFKSVQVACMLEFIAMDLDMLVCVRTAPNQSFNNPAERMMSLLNLGLQSVALSRSPMSEGQEMQARRLSSLKAIRNYSGKNEQFKSAYKASMDEPIKLVSERFGRLKLKEEAVMVHKASGDSGLDDMCDLIKVLDDEYDCHKMNDFRTSDKVAKFFDDHSRSRQYSFQLKKCNSECGYCTINPPRLPEDVFHWLHFLPDPVLDDGNTYKPFADLYGTTTTDDQRPALKLKPELTTVDKTHKSLFVGAKVRGRVLCCECGKRRVVYSAAKLTPPQHLALLRAEDELLYTCGSTLFEGPLKEIVVVKEGQNCSSPIETTYYSGNIICTCICTTSMEAICFHCGDPSDLADDNNIHVRELHEKFGVVRPICTSCLNSGKEPPTRNKRVGHKRKCLK